jgi:hypothetical protein
MRFGEGFEAGGFEISPMKRLEMHKVLMRAARLV